MNPRTIVAIALIGLGAVAFAYQGFTYTTRGRDVAIGSIHMTTEHRHHVPLPPVLGAISLIGGIALLMVDRRNVNRLAGGVR